MRQEIVYIYRGNLVNSQIQGFGEFKWADGRHYIGDFVNSQMHGNGKLSWFEPTKSQSIPRNGRKAVNTVYKGQLTASVIHGRGTLTKANGDTYIGEFENGLFNGEGEYKWAGGNLKYKGQYRNGQMHGYGVLHN